MRRREFITLLSAATAWPFNAFAQQPAKVWRIAYLSPAATFNPVDEAFEKSLEQLGWARDRNIEIEYRYIEGRQDKIGPLVAELVGLGPPDLFVAWGPPLGLTVPSSPGSGRSASCIGQLYASAAACPQPLAACRRRSDRRCR